MFTAQSASVRAGFFLPAKSQNELVESIRINLLRAQGNIVA